MGTKLSLKSSGYGCEANLVLVEALKQLRSEAPRKASRVMIEVQLGDGATSLIELVMSMSPKVREKTSVLIKVGEHGISHNGCRVLKALRNRSGVGLAVMVENWAWAGCLEALEALDAETVIVGRSMVGAVLAGECKVLLGDIAELCERQGARLVAQGDLTEEEMGSMEAAGVSAFLGMGFEAVISIGSLEGLVCNGLWKDGPGADKRAKDLMVSLNRARALQT
jgi:EAL domain-containing protein (putative c-di-GMP-specific phosphodiesterase class I)